MIKNRFAAFLLLSVVAFSSLSTNARQANAWQSNAQDKTESNAEQESNVEDFPSVGVSKLIEQIVLPGTLLTHKPVDPTSSALIVRVVDTFPHGDSFRYDISYFGLEPGEFDLRDYLIREDGSSTEDLPPIPVKVRSILDSGQITPNDLGYGLLSGMGGYWNVLWMGILVWFIVLVLLFVVGKGKKKAEEVFVAKPLTVADRLEPNIRAAIAGELSKEKHAELERMLFVFWQNRLDMPTSDPAETLRELRQHPESGPLLKQVELWLHSPDQSGSVDIPKLLKPYENIRAEEFDHVADKVQFSPPASGAK